MGAVADLGPVRGRARIDVLDAMRGVAILGILYMNIPFMGSNVASWMGDIRRLSWTHADQVTWAAIAIIWEGTQRGPVRDAVRRRRDDLHRQGDAA